MVTVPQGGASGCRDVGSVVPARLVPERWNLEGALNVSGVENNSEPWASQDPDGTKSFAQRTLRREGPQVRNTERRRAMVGAILVGLLLGVALGLFLILFHPQGL